MFYHNAFITEITVDTIELIIINRIRNENSKQIYYSLYQHYIRDYDKNLKSPSYSNILCVLVRYAVSV